MLSGNFDISISIVMGKLNEVGNREKIYEVKEGRCSLKYLNNTYESLQRQSGRGGRRRGEALTVTTVFFSGE